MRLPSNIARHVPASLCLLLLWLFSVSSCEKLGSEGKPPSVATSPGEQPAAQAEQVLRLHGSNTIGLSLAPALAKGFFAELGAVNVVINGDDRKSERIRVQGLVKGKPTAIEVYARGSKVGFESLAAGACDIALSSRPIKTEEASALKALGDMTAPSSDHVVGIDGIAVIVHKKNKAAKLTTKQLAAIFAGEAGDWSQVGGAAGPIHVYTRDAKSGTYDAFSAIVMGGKAIKSGAKPFDDSEALSTAVAADEGGIGYVGLPYVKEARSIAVQDGDATPLFATVFTVATEDYALSRRLHFYTPETPANPLTRPFVDYALSDAGQRIVEGAGFVSLAVKGESPSVPAGAPADYAADVKGAIRLSVDFRFRTGRSELDTKALSDIDRVLRFLSAPENRGKHTILHGFADNQGGEKVNLELSKTRADTVARELKQRGISADKATGWGSALPIAPNDTPDGRERNRRVEIWVR